MGLGCDHGCDSVNLLSGCIECIFDRSFSDSILAGVSKKISPSSLVAHSHQNISYAPAWGTYADCHSNEGAWGLR
jgi:hypothetical protein